MTSTLPKSAASKDPAVAQIQAELDRQKKAVRDQSALFRIAKLAASADDMATFYKGVHEILKDLLFAENIFVVLYDEDRRQMSFAYYVDELDDDWPDPSEWQTIGEGPDAKGLGAYVLKTGETIHATPDVMKSLVADGKVEFHGGVSVDFLGVPLVSEDQTVGALAVQSYTEGRTYDKGDEELLAFVAEHIGSALARTKAVADLRERNAELAVVNEIGAALAKQLDFQGIVDAVGDRAGRDLRQRGHVHRDRRRGATNMIEFPYWTESGERTPTSRQWRSGQGMTSQIVLASGPGDPSGTAAEAEALGVELTGSRRSPSSACRSQLAIDAIGVLSLSAKPERHFLGVRRAPRIDSRVEHGRGARERATLRRDEAPPGPNGAAERRAGSRQRGWTGPR